MIIISDTGEGIDQYDLPYIFNRFYKGKNAKSESIGIGLAMSKSILENQGAVIEAISEKNKGTRFIIKIYKSIVWQNCHSNSHIRVIFGSYTQAMETKIGVK